MPATVWILMAVQALSMSVAPLVIFAGGLVGRDLAPSPALATLPIALLVVGTALTVVPVTRLMAKLGRKQVFVAGGLFAGSGALVAAGGIYLDQFLLFCLAALLMGASLAVAQQYRFAAMEAAEPAKAGRAASQVLLGGLLAAYLGPELVVWGESVNALPFSESAFPSHEPLFGAFLLLSLIGFSAALILLLAYRNQTVQKSAENIAPRPLSVIFRSPLIWLAILSAALGYAVMSFVMTATPLNMHIADGHSLLDTKWVIQSHIIAMFVPSFFSGWLITRFGHRRVIAAGVIAYAICIAVAFSGRELLHYWWALVLLGVGWNFLFVGGTALLPLCHQPGERFRVQSVNEFSVFGIQALAALSSGWVVSSFGWPVLLAVSVLMLGVVVAALWASRSAQPEPSGNQSSATSALEEKACESA